MCHAEIYQPESGPSKELNYRETCAQSLQGTSTNYQNVLGLNWKADSDEFKFGLGVIYDAAKNVHVTKGNILQIAAMFFNPLRLIVPITLQPKLLYQEVWRKKFDSDELINDTNINDKWSKCLPGLGSTHLLSAPRHALSCQERGVEIHGFCDNSGVGYDECVFVRVVCEHGSCGQVSED